MYNLFKPVPTARCRHHEQLDARREAKRPKHGNGVGDTTGSGETIRRKTREYLLGIRTTIEQLESTGASPTSIARELNRRGIKTSRGRQWGEMSVRYAFAGLGLRGEKLPEVGEA